MSTTNNTTEKVISKIDLNGETYKFKDTAARDQLTSHDIALSIAAEHIANKDNPHQVELSDFGVNATATEINILSGASGITSANLNKLSNLTENVQSKLNGLDATLTQLNADMLESTYYIETELTEEIINFMGSECQKVVVKENLASIFSKKNEGKNPCLLLKPFSLDEDNAMKDSAVPLFLTRELKIEDEIDGTFYFLLFSSSTVFAEEGLGGNTNLANISSGIINILLAGYQAADAQETNGILILAPLAPMDHASSKELYGLGDNENYGHVKLSDTISETDGVNSGIALTPKALYDYNNAIGTIIGQLSTNFTNHTTTSNPHGISLSTFGVDATASELNILDGVTNVTSTNINHLSGLSQNVQTNLETLKGNFTTLFDGDPEFKGKPTTTTPLPPTGADKPPVKQIANVEYVLQEIDRVLLASDAMNFKGVFDDDDTTKNENSIIISLPPKADIGDTYKVGINAEFANQKCEIGDLAICLQSYATAPTTNLKDYWAIVQSNVDGTVTGPVNASSDNIAVFDGTTGKIIKDSKISAEGMLTSINRIAAELPQVYPAERCVTFTSDESTGDQYANKVPSTLTPLAAQKAAKVFAITRPQKRQSTANLIDGELAKGDTTDKAIARWLGNNGDIQDSKIIIEDVAHNTGTGQRGQAFMLPTNKANLKLISGYCNNQVDGTVLLARLFDEANTDADYQKNMYSYSEGLAIGGSSGNLLWKGEKVITSNAEQALTNKTYNGYTLGPACAKSVDTTPTLNSNNLITSGAAYNLTIPRNGYGTCTTAKSTAAKEATIEGDFTLTPGSTIAIKFANDVIANSTLNVNGKGTKNILYKGASLVDGIIGAGEVATFIYDGSRFHLLNVDRNRFFTTLIPFGTEIKASTEATKVDLNTPEYQKVGNYFCISNANAAYIDNLPKTNTAFMMQVYSPISKSFDNENGTWVYRLRKITFYTGEEFVQYNYTDGTAGHWNYGVWKQSFQFVPTTGTSKYLREDGVWGTPPDTDTKVISASHHYSPTYDSTLSTNASSTTSATWGSTSLVTGVNIAKDSKGHITGVTVDSIQMPSNPNSDTKVTNTLSTDKVAYVTGTTLATTNTSTQVFNTRVYLNTTAGELVADTFKGHLEGTADYATEAGTADSAHRADYAREADNAGWASEASWADNATYATSAGTASKATKDSLGQTISTTYQTKVTGMPAAFKYHDLANGTTLPDGEEGAILITYNTSSQ